MNSSTKIFAPLHGGQLGQIAARYDIRAEDLVDFSVNINPAGPPPSVRAAIHRAIDEPGTLTNYPDLQLTKLKRVIAERNGLNPENIAVANGFVPLLQAALQSLPIRRCLLPVPCFAEYGRTLQDHGCEIVPFHLSADTSFQYDPDAIFQELLNRSCDALLIANPQNPSGALFESNRMQRLIENASQHKIFVLLDEAFIDYCPTHSLVSEAAGRRELIVFRSVTKFFAIPGLRVAYSVTNPAATQSLSNHIAPWPITTLASDGVCAALSDDLYARETLRLNERRRGWLERELTKLAISVYPSTTNFLLLRLPTKIDVPSLWERMIVEQHAVLRLCTNFEGLDPGHLRVAVRSDADNKRLIHGLHNVITSMRSS
jgi:threonine-phosphate decarboxylase